MDPILHIELLGGFRLRYGAEPVPRFESQRLQSLLSYLLLHSNAPQPRQQIAFALWPVSSESQARTNLRKLLLQLRRALPEAGTFLMFDNQSIGWRRDSPYTLDVDRVQQQLQLIRDNPLDRAAFTRIFELYHGELLPGCYDDWIVPLRTQLHGDVMTALDRLITLLENQREYDEAIRYAQRLLAWEPLEEQRYRRLMRLHALNGDRAGALRLYRECVEVLQRELSVPPSEETQAAYERLCQRQAEPHGLLAQPKPRVERIPLVGRQPEWQMLQQIWREASRGQPRLVSIQGVAGIGKTRLAEEILDWTTVQGARTARTRSYQAHQSMAYTPVTELLREETIHGALDRLAPLWLSEIARLLPELLQRHPELPPPQPMTESWQRQRFFEALARAVLQDEHPRLLLLDDLQWSDPDTLEWLQFLLRFDPGARLLIVGTVRTGEAETTPALSALQRDLQRDDLLTGLSLAPLSPSETTILAHHLDGRTEGDGAADGNGATDAVQLFHETEGNPLFVVETMRAWGSQQADTGTDAATIGLPPKVYSVIKAHLAQLSPEARRIANLAATVGRSFDFQVLQAASSADEDEMLDSIDELWQRHVIREQSADRYDFSHDRIRDVVYAEISQTRRRVLHRRVAQALEHIYAQELDECAASLANHFEHARNPAKAVEYLQRAGERAATQFANGSAIDFFTRALNLIDYADVPKRLELLLSRERLLYYQSKVEAQEQDLRAMRTLIEDVGDRTADGKWYAASVYTRWANWYAAVGDYAAAVQSMHQAIEVAQESGDSAVEADALSECGRIYFEQGKLRDARGFLLQALDTARRVDGMRSAKASNWLSAVCMYTGAPVSEILGYLQEAEAIYRALNDLRGQIDINHKTAYTLIAHGENGYEEAENCIAVGLTLAHQLGTLINEAQLRRNLGWLYVYTGEYSAANRELGQAVMMLEETNVTFAATAHAYVGFYYLQTGDWTNARTYLEKALSGFRTVERTRPHRTVTLHLLGALHLNLEEYAAALDYADQALQAATPRGDSRHLATAHTCRGHALLGMDNLNEAEKNYREARRLYVEIEQINRGLEALAGLADVALRRGNPGDALALLDEYIPHLEAQMLDRTDEALYVYTVARRVLHANGDPRADRLLQIMREQLQARAATIESEELRTLFWDVPAHRKVLEA